MPNWVSNSVVIEGPVADLEALILKATGPDEEGVKQEFTLNGFVKQPKDVFHGNLGSEEEKLYPGDKNWYGWNTKHWGTKWDCSDVDMKKELTPLLDQMAEAYSGKRDEAEPTGKVTYTFNTAWSAPDPVIRALAHQFPSLTVEHEWSDEDSGGGNHGRTNYENGEETCTVEFNGHEPSEDLIEMAIRLKGHNPYLPKCEECYDDLPDQDVSMEQVVCGECREKAAKEEAKSEK